MVYPSLQYFSHEETLHLNFDFNHAWLNGEVKSCFKSLGSPPNFWALIGRGQILHGYIILFMGGGNDLFTDGFRIKG